MDSLRTLLCILPLLTSLAYGEPRASATAKVFVNVRHHLAVASSAVANAGTIDSGRFSATIHFRLDANVQALSLHVEATDLYKGDDPTLGEVAPIPLDLVRGVTISPRSASPVNGAGNIATYVDDSMIGDFPARKTRKIRFESGQADRFGQDVAVMVTWNQDDPGKPTGQYSGRVRLTALLLP